MIGARLFQDGWSGGPGVVGVHAHDALAVDEERELAKRVQICAAGRSRAGREQFLMDDAVTVSTGASAEDQLFGSRVRVLTGRPPLGEDDPRRTIVGKDMHVV